MNAGLKITFLGTGAAGGVPLSGCRCLACARAERAPRYRREPCSALVETGETLVLIDAGLMDLHRHFTPGELDAILLTHFHPDYVQGLLHLRWGRGSGPVIA
ncbi:MAG: MBL fold metallo-hydrolase [Marinobacter sp.]